jgi:hypothetical protein
VLLSTVAVKKWWIEARAIEAEETVNNAEFNDGNLATYNSMSLLCVYVQTEEVRDLGSRISVSA